MKNFTMTKWIALLIVLAALGVVSTVLAQSDGVVYTLLRSTVDNGGGMLTSGAYTLNSTAGQPDAGALAAGTYTLNGGFWGKTPVSETVYLPPTAAFTATPLSGVVPFTVAFTDLSTGDLTAWTWDFGDGGISGARHPAHTYTAPGTYTVTLTVEGPAGSDTEAKVGSITARLPEGTPTCEITYIYPNPVTQALTQTLYFNGNCHDNDADEGGAYMVGYRWHSSIDGQLSTAEDFTIPAVEISAGTHTISLQGQDDEGLWSLPVTGTLMVNAQPADTIRTLILVNRQKLVRLYSEADAAQVMAKLDALAAHDSVQGVVVQVDGDAAVAAAYAAWDAAPTSTAHANAVVDAIKAVVDAHWAAHPDLEYLVIVGDDRAIPFRRVPDQTRYPERYYPFVTCDSTTGAALCADMTLTDDAYSDAAPTLPNSANWDGHALYIPDLGTGRLIETPAEIVAQIDVFLLNDGVVAEDAIVTAYDFLKDGAWAMCAALNNDGLATECDLVSETWNRTDFVNRVLNTRHDVVSINNHTHHYLVDTPSGTVATSDIAGATADHTRAIIYTVGCHAGLNVPPTNPTQPLDLAQSLVQRMAYYVANTGFGWGYHTSVGLSERLMLNFTERLVYGQSSTLGQALASAKQEYYLDEGDFDYYDEKILIESTLYGLPMARYTTPTAMRRAGHLPQAPSAIRGEQHATLGNGLTVNSLSLQFPALIAESTGDGDFYSFGDQTHTGNGSPVQPKYTTDVSFPATQGHDAVFRGGIYTDVVSFNPVVDRTVTAPGWDITQLCRLNHLNQRDRLVMFLGQFTAAGQTERVYDQLRCDVYYHTDSDDWTRPTINSVRSQYAGGNATVTVAADDRAGLAVLVVAYTDGGGLWQSVDLTQSGSVWTGSFPADEHTVFLAQAVDNAGNVATDDNDGQYFPAEFGGKINTVFLPLVVRESR
jgi:PKD repeat protein